MPSPFFVNSATGPVGGLAHFPARPGPHPAVILAPGRGYHMDLPLLRELCVELAQRRIAAWRFDWGGGDPADELRAVLDEVLDDPRVDRRRVVLGGKSMGSIVAWATRRPDLAGYLLLTPLVKPGQAEGGYPGLLRVERPVLLLGGKADPQAQGLPALAAGTPDHVTVALVGGGHDLQGPEQDSVALAVQLAAGWAEALLGDRPAAV